MTRIDEKIRWAMKMGRMQHMTPKGGSTQHDTYSRETTSAPPTGWLSYETCCRQITDVQDIVRGMEEKQAIKEAILSDYRERVSSLGALVEEKEERITQMQQENSNKREDNDIGMATTGINTSILLVNAMS